MATPRVASPRIVACRDCGTDVIAGRAGLPPERCAPCRTARRKAWDHQNRPRKTERQAERRRACIATRAPWGGQTLVCVICSVEFSRRSPKGPTPQRCPLCVAFALAVGLLARQGRMSGGQGFLAAEIFERDGHRCYLCGGVCSGAYPAPMAASLDHVMPIARGGLHTRDNVRTAHLLCNMSKGTREWGLATTA